ncbi:MAG TPA: glycosyltransferase family 4 protein [Methanosarcinales archaeon]|nr:glycosyltransferase family 4 protein [Methanosarcinales archaeon]
MKILIVHPQMALYGGAELVIVRLAQYLMKQGHNVTVATLSTDSHSEYKGIKFILPEKNRISYRLRGGLGSIYDIIQMQIALQKLCSKYANNFDIINVHNFPAIWAVPNHRKIVWMCNEVPDLWHNAKVNGLANKVFNIARHFDSRIVKSKDTISIVADNRCAEVFRKRYKFEPVIIHYGIDSFSAQHNPSTRQFRVICTSMISPSKDQLSILKAVKVLKKYIPNIKVILSGYREPEHPYSIMLDKYTVDNKLDVEYIAMTDRNKLAGIYSCSNVAVFAGKGQGSWLSPFEQLSMGIPVIVTPNLTCSDLIFQQNIGIVTDDITGALLSVYNNYSEYKEQALKGKEFVLNELTWEKFGRKVEKILCSAN